MSYGQVETAFAVDSEYIETSSQQKKVKKPGFIKRWLLNSLKEAVQAENQQKQIDESDILIKPRRGFNSVQVQQQQLDSQPMNMKVYRANGGTIVEVTVYDRQKDRTQNQLHIITHDTDLGQGLAKIITMETLRG
jgi:hypothetical protein